MKRRKSYFENFPTSTLFIVLEQNMEELLLLETQLLSCNNLLLSERLKQVKLVIQISKNVIIQRYLDENISLTKIAKLLVSSHGIKEIVYKEIFTLKIMDSNDFISLNLLEKAIDKLDIEHLILIMKNKENTIYESVAIKKYDKLIFNLDEEVLKDLEKKKRMDRRK